MKRGTGRVIKAQPRPVRPVPNTNSSQKPVPAARKPSPLQEPLPRTPVTKVTATRKPTLKPIPPAPSQQQAKRMERRASPAPPKREPRQPAPRNQATAQSRPPPQAFGDLPRPGTIKFHNEWVKRMKASMELFSFDGSPDQEVWLKHKYVALMQVAEAMEQDEKYFNKLNEEEIDSLFKVLEKNLFRPRQHVPATELFYEVPSGMFEKAWYHLEMVYNILAATHSLVPNDKHFNEAFVDGMFGLFSVGFASERMAIMSFMKEYYVYHVSQREFMVKKLLAIIEKHLLTQDEPFATATCLPVFLQMCEAEEEDVEAMYKAIEDYMLPLITDTYVFFYGVGLDLILDFYTAGQPENAERVVARIVHYWPRQNTAKMCTYTSMLIEYLPRMLPEAQDRYVPQMFPLFAENCMAPSPRLAEASFQIFLAPNFDEIMWRNCDKIIQMMVPSVVRAMTEHWETSIRDIARLCMSIMEKFHPELVQQVASETMSEEKEQKPKELDAWKMVAAAAKKNDSSIHSHKFMDKAKIAYRPPPPCSPCEVHDGTINAG